MPQNRGSRLGLVSFLCSTANTEQCSVKQYRAPIPTGSRAYSPTAPHTSTQTSTITQSKMSFNTRLKTTKMKMSSIIGQGTQGDPMETGSGGTLTSASACSSIKSQSSSSDVLRLTMCQAANGSFPPQADIASILGVEHAKVLEAGKAISSGATFTTTWMTVVVVAFLTEKCKEEKDVWELVVEKAKRWLQNNGDGFVSVHLEKAQEFILQAIPIKKSSSKTWPRGHILSLATPRDGSAWHCDSMSRCVGGCSGDGNHSHQSVWRCSQDWRVISGGTCDFHLCGECVKKNV